MNKTPTITQLMNLGFEIVTCYEHDNFITQRRKKGRLTTEKTWDKDNEHKEVSFEVQLDDSDWTQITFHELNVLDLIFNKAK